MKKTPVSGGWKFIKKSAKVLFVIESLAFAASYGIWHNLNISRDYRQYMHKNYPFLLEYYYSVGEFLGDKEQRHLDSIVFKAEKD